MPHLLAQQHSPTLNEQTIWLIIGVGGMAILYFLLRPRSKRPDPLSAAPKFSLARQREVEGQMQNLLVELSQMSRQITAQLDTRAAKLELLLKEADERLAALRAAGAEAGNFQARAAAVENDSSGDGARTAAMAPPPPPAAPEIDQRHAEVYRLADEGRATNEIARLVNRPVGEVELILALRSR